MTVHIKMLKWTILIVLITGVCATYKIKEVKPGFIIENVGEGFTQHGNIRINLILEKSELRKTSKTLKSWINNLKSICRKQESELCTQLITTEMELSVNMVDMLLQDLKQRKKKDVGDDLLGLFGWQKINGWDEYNLRAIRENDKTVENNIKRNARFIMEIRNYVLKEKKHNTRKFALLEEELKKTIDQIQNKTMKAVADLTIVEMIWVVEDQILNTKKQINPIAQSIDKIKHVSMSEVFEIVKNETVMKQIIDECGSHGRMSLNRAQLITRNEKDWLNSTLIIPIFDDRKFQMFKLTTVPRILRENIVQLPKIEANYVGIADSSHQYIEIEDMRNECEIDGSLYFCQVNRVKTFNRNSSCLAKAMFTEDANEDCPVETIQLEKGYYFQKLAIGGDYMYVMTTERDSVVECSGSRRIERLEGSGIISLGKDCQILDNWDTLYPLVDHEIQLTRYLKDKKWSVRQDEPTKSLKSVSVIMVNEKLTDLPQLEAIIFTDNNAFKDVNYTGVSIGIIMAVIIISYCILKTNCMITLCEKFNRKRVLNRAEIPTHVGSKIDVNKEMTISSANSSETWREE